MGKKRWFVDGLYMLVTICAAYFVNLGLITLFDTRTLVPMVFVLGVFLVSWDTQGYFWGIVDSLLSVLAVNYTFTYPYYAFDLITPECLVSAVVMLVVAVMTGMMTTQLKKQEKMRAEAEKERMRGNLLRAVSHDLRTPLTSIYGNCTQMIEHFDEISPQEQKEMLEDVRMEAQWLVGMVENLLSVTRVNAQGVRLTKKDTALEELLDASIVKFHKRFAQQAVQVQIPEEFISIAMDAMLVQQAILNLLENAVNHAKGMENLWINVKIEGENAIFCVSDDGCGIEPGKIASLFSGASVQRSDTSEAGSNMGIGLSVCAAIVKAHGGTIWAGNRPEGGAQVCFTIPMEEGTYGESV